MNHIYMICFIRFKVSSLLKRDAGGIQIMSEVYFIVLIGLVIGCVGVVRVVMKYRKRSESVHRVRKSSRGGYQVSQE